MLWFFIAPCLAFMAWAAFELVKNVSLPKVEKTVFARIEDIRAAKNPGDRWQAALLMSQGLQKTLRQGELKTWPADQQDELFSKLGSLLDEFSGDARISKYLIVTLGQSQDARAVPALLSSISKADAELKFFASWALVDVLSHQPSARSPEINALIREWLGDSDLARIKVASAYLAQYDFANSQAELESLLSHTDREVRWNAAVSLASVGQASATKTLREIFTLKNLRDVDFKSAQDLESLLASAALAAKKLGDANIIAQAQNLKSEIKPETPEGRAVVNALKNL